MTIKKRAATLKADTALKGHNLPKTWEASITYAGDLATQSRDSANRSKTLMIDMGLEYARAIVTFKGGVDNQEMADEFMAKCFPDQPMKVKGKGGNMVANMAYSVKRSQLRSFAFKGVLASKPDYDAIMKLPGEKWLNCYKVHKAIDDKSEDGKPPVKVTADLIKTATAKKAAAKPAAKPETKQTPAQKADEAITLLRSVFTAFENAKVRAAAIAAAELSKVEIAALDRLMAALETE